MLVAEDNGNKFDSAKICRQLEDMPQIKIVGIQIELQTGMGREPSDKRHPTFLDIAPVVALEPSPFDFNLPPGISKDSSLPIIRARSSGVGYRDQEFGSTCWRKYEWHEALYAAESELGYVLGQLNADEWFVPHFDVANDVDNGILAVEIRKIVEPEEVHPLALKLLLQAQSKILGAKIRFSSVDMNGGSLDSSVGEELKALEGSSRKLMIDAATLTTWIP